MAKFKLFVSHSSRLDDIDHEHPDDDYNWRLLGEVCAKIREVYGERVEVLVDRDGLLPGEDWNHQLNLWLAECHVAVILFSKRAIENSNWVAKEAAILSWRRELDPNFILIPVLLDGETSPEDLAREFFGTLKIDTSQCIRNARSAEDIVADLVRNPRLDPETLAQTHPETPLERLQGGFARLLGEEASEAELETVLSELGIAIPSEFFADKKIRYATLLAKHLLVQGIDHFDQFKRAINPLFPGPRVESVEALFRQIRCLWVDPCAAASIPSALDHKNPLALNGKLLTYTDPVVGAVHYTLERYIERAWAGCTQSLAVPVDTSQINDVNQVINEIRKTMLGNGPLPAGIADEIADRVVNEDLRVIILFVHSASPETGLPDRRFLNQLSGLHRRYTKLVIVLQSFVSLEHLPDQVNPVVPELDLEAETLALTRERSTRTFLDQKYGIQR